MPGMSCHAKYKANSSSTAPDGNLPRPPIRKGSRSRDCFRRLRVPASQIRQRYPWESSHPRPLPTAACSSTSGTAATETSKAASPTETSAAPAPAPAPTAPASASASARNVGQQQPEKNAAKRSEEDDQEYDNQNDDAAERNSWLRPIVASRRRARLRMRELHAGIGGDYVCHPAAD